MREHEHGDSMTAISPARALLLAALLSTAAAQAGCQGCDREKETRAKPAAAPPLAGLEAIPHDVQVILGANVEKLRTSFLVKRMVAQMFRRDPELEKRIDQLIATCKLDPAEDVESIILALNQREGEAIVVLTGTFVEAELTRCINQSMAEAGGTMTFKEVGNRKFYRAGGAQESWFTVAGPRTLVVATSSAWLAKAVGATDASSAGAGKGEAARPMAGLLSRVDQSAGVWGVGLIDVQTGAGLVELTSGRVATPPRAGFVEMDLVDGARVSLGFEMSSEEASKQLLSKLKTEVDVGAWLLQQTGLQSLAKNVGVDSEGKTVYLRLSLTEHELKEVLSRIDTSKGSTQDPPKPEE